MQNFDNRIKREFFDKIPYNSRLAIFGVNDISSKIYKDIISKRNDIEIVCFLEINKTDEFENKKVYSVKEFFEKTLDIDFVVVTTSNNIFVENVLDIIGVPFFTVTSFIVEYYKEKHEILNDLNYQNIINIFAEDSDKQLFDIIFRRRKNVDDDRFLAQHFRQNYQKQISVNRTIKNQYLEKIDKNRVNFMLDLGFNSGFNAIAYYRFLPNLKMIYAFEAIYDLLKNSFIESFFPQNKLTIVKSAVGDTKLKTKFYVNNSNPNASMITFSNSLPDKNITNTTHKIIDVDVTTIDDFCRASNIKPDFIKMDIEGAELPALKGGMETIKKYRPQMAISIYHCDSDFINIPKYLYQNLDDYIYKLGHYSPDINETVLYALPKNNI